RSRRAPRPTLLPYTTLFRSREQYERNSAITLGEGAVAPWLPELVDCGYYASLREAFKKSLPSYFRAIASPFGVRREAIISHAELDRKSTRLNSSHVKISYAV